MSRPGEFEEQFKVQRAFTRVRSSPGLHTKRTWRRDAEASETHRGSRAHTPRRQMGLTPGISVTDERSHPTSLAREKLGPTQKPRRPADPGPARGPESSGSPSLPGPFEALRDRGPTTVPAPSRRRLEGQQRRLWGSGVASGLVRGAAGQGGGPEVRRPGAGLERPAPPQPDGQVLTGRRRRRRAPPPAQAPQRPEAAPRGTESREREASSRC